MAAPCATVCYLHREWPCHYCFFERFEGFAIFMNSPHARRTTHHREASPRDATSDKFRALSETIRASMAHLHIPGVAVGLLWDDEVFTAGLGVNNVEHPLPVDAGTLFQIGSITKTVTGTVLLRLREAG